MFPNLSGGHVIEEFLTARVTSSSPQSLLAGRKSGRHPFFNKLRTLNDSVAFGGGDFRSLVSLLPLEASYGEVSICFKRGGWRIMVGVGMDGLILFTGGMLPTSRPLCTDSTKLCSTQVNFINFDLIVKEVALANLVWSTCGGVLDLCINIFLVKLVIALASDRMASRRFDYLEKLRHKVFRGLRKS